MEIVNLKSASEDLLQRCAKLYCEIWKEPPWNEDFWEPEGVMQDLRRGLSMPCVEGFLSLHDFTVTGFTWGHAVSRREMEVISTGSKLDYLFLNSGRVFYVDELGVASSFRHIGIGETLTKTLLVAAREHDIRAITLRTNKNAHAARKLYQKIGFRDLMVEDGKHPDRTYWVLAL